MKTDLQGKKIGILIESDYYENEIFYYKLRFAEEGIQVDFLTRLWGNSIQVYEGHEFRAKLECNLSFEDIDEQALSQYSAIIVPAGFVSDRLRYSENTTKVSPAVEFMKRAFANKNIIKGIICHGMWLMSPASEIVNGRKCTVHNNLIGDAKNMGINYVDEDIVVDDDLITARTGNHCNLFAKKIIEKMRSYK